MSSPPGPNGASGGSRGALRDGLAASLLLLVAVALQVVSGAYQSEAGTTSPDEAAHFVSGLMVRDYLVGALGSEPVRYALEYYSHYPKVAIGNWPPVFYLLQGVWMAVLPARPESVLVLIAACAAGTAYIVLRLLRGVVRVPYAWLCASLFLLLPPVPRYLGGVLAELPLTLLATAALFHWIRFVDSGRRGHAVAFAGFAVLAALTKGNGLFLCLVPLLSILIGRRWALLASRPLWYTVLAVLLVTVPWIGYFFETIRAGWLDVEFSPGFTRAALLAYPAQLARSLGPVLSGLAVIGAWMGLRRTRGRESAIWEVALASCLAAVLFHSLVPTGLSRRHMIVAFPAVLLLAGGGLRTVDRWLGARLHPQRVAAALVVVTAGSFMALSFRLPHQGVRGYGAAAEQVRASVGRGAASTSLVVSDAIGEGAYIVEMASRDPLRPHHTVWRGSKLLSSATWAGRDYVLRARSEAELLRLLERAGIQAVLVDRSSGTSPHRTLLERTIAAHPHRFRPGGRVGVERPGLRDPGELLVYEFVRGDAPTPHPPLRQLPGEQGIAPVDAVASGHRPEGAGPP